MSESHPYTGTCPACGAKRPLTAAEVAAIPAGGIACRGGAGKYPAHPRAVVHVAAVPVAPGRPGV